MCVRQYLLHAIAPQHTHTCQSELVRTNARFCAIVCLCLGVCVFVCAAVVCFDSVSIYAYVYACSCVFVLVFVLMHNQARNQAHDAQ